MYQKEDLNCPRGNKIDFCMRYDVLKLMKEVNSAIRRRLCFFVCCFSEKYVVTLATFVML